MLEHVNSKEMGARETRSMGDDMERLIVGDADFTQDCWFGVRCESKMMNSVPAEEYKHPERYA